LVKKKNSGVHLPSALRNLSGQKVKVRERVGGRKIRLPSLGREGGRETTKRKGR